ncbi:unnamed protein product [Rotaria socialis]|uniref:Cadherin domain-containing protein n=2 Tax=Rotaria socialis TaxID=392032 RepID=A0A817VD89_9BILA|nr:unnamed protein product [Rotaria socialis]CAF3344328.1 unnamed protein product [Rotaria socialis]CAF3434228.1 unnamed protein product [Rotaria socialis]CAF4294945.1 unnamed protein product [Rotaria socialis]CAF4400319.1 unnamed protein product [Rotaria socialis]
MLQLLVFINFLFLVSSAPKQSIHIIEDLPIGTSIYTFITDGCKTENSTGTYRFVDSQKNSNDFFLIDPYTGRVITKKLIDRDDFCLRRMCSCSKCEITLEVICVHMGQIYFNDLSVVIDDRNDHAPEFPKSSITIDVLENVPIGYLIPLDVAIDRDYGINSIQGYKLIEENSTNKSSINKIPQAFQIEYSQKNDLLALRLMKILDRESCDSLKYIMQAYDGGQPQALMSKLNILINILDVNDMSPVFDQSYIRVLLSEATSIGSLVARVHAHDGDTGLNGLVYYTIVSLDPPSNGTFTLSKETGEIRLAKKLDYEKEKAFRMKVKAQDNGPQQGSIAAFATIDIDLKDENDNHPLITTTFNDDPTSGVENLLNRSIIRIRENTPNGTFLGHISISDLDQGDNGRVSWSLESNGTIAIKELLNNEAFLMFTQRIYDREEQSRYEINLEAHDHGIPPLLTTLNFTLIILDENDNAPKFDKEFYSINISETIPINTKLLHFHAVDNDEENTLNSQIEYLFANETNQTIFLLNSTTGDLYLIARFDREETSIYEFDVIAMDHGQPQSLSSIVHCTIYLIDINDNFPIFDLPEYQFEIAETWPSLAPIGHVYATDADEYYGELQYMLISNESTILDQWPFGLTVNGTLYLKRTSVGIDYEHRSKYKFSIMAIDNGGLNTTVPVTINILNRNDFCPELINNSTALFFNKDLWLYNASQNLNEFYLDIYDGDNDTCLIELLNFNDIFRIESKERNRFLLSAFILPEHEFYILQFRLHDLVSIDDQPCIQTIQLALAIGTNETNQTVTLDTAREYLEALRLTSKRSHSYFDLTLLNVILLFVLLSIAIVIALVGMKLVFLPPSSSSSSLSSTSSLSLRHQRMRQQRKLRSNRNGNATGGTLYCLQGPTETQLPLLENGPGEHSLTSSLIDGNMKMDQDENINHSIDNDVHADEQKQHLLSQFNQFSSSTVKNPNEFRTFALKSTNNPYDIIGYIHSNEQHCSSSSSSSSSYNRVRDSGYETISSIEQQQQQQQHQHCASPSSPSNVSLSPDGQTITVTYFSSPLPCHSDSLSSSLSCSNTIPRTLKTFCQMPVTIASGNESSTMMNACLAEQEIIEL